MGTLQEINKRFIEIMKKEPGVIGAWEFGSALHGMTDQYSDIDIVFLVEENDYSRIDRKLMDLLKMVCDRVVIFWPESFNGDAVKNYNCILECGTRLFEYDIFLLNREKLEDYMCQMHYTGLKQENIIFDTNHVISDLAQNAPEGTVWKDDIMRLVQTYWLHISMSAKYFLREDYFKLEGVLRILMDTHTSLLLTAYDRITWGGTANKLSFLEKEKQDHLKKYFCSGDFYEMRVNLLQAMDWFEEDMVHLGDAEALDYSRRVGETIRTHWAEVLELQGGGKDEGK